MQEINRLKKLRDLIIGIEMHLTVLQSDLSAVDRDIDFLEGLDLILKENITVLKTDGIITIASEYKKTREELETVRENLKYYISMKHSLKRDYDRHTEMKENSIVEFEELKKYLNNCKVVLLFDQSKRKK